MGQRCSQGLGRRERKLRQEDTDERVPTFWSSFIVPAGSWLGGAVRWRFRLFLRLLQLHDPKDGHLHDGHSERGKRSVCRWKMSLLGSR